MNAMIIVADLGRMKAYRITRDELQPGTSPAFEDIADVDLENQHSRVSDRVTDKAGRFGHGPGGIAVGERHNEESEAEEQQLQAIAGKINEVASNGDGSIHLAAPRTMLRRLLEALNPSVRQRVHRDLPLNLVKAPKLELLERFQIA
ncbi:host attachment protein [Luteolibacter marinus]|uniref:host attachment protein n=1 Tax=Luteolibacter marinus TaxID=2776705 RepID=UPI0018673233|nr:host attachment protein [Luteolibacter marinus]